MNGSVEFEITSKKYAKVLFDLAKGENSVLSVRDELSEISAIFDKSPETLDYLSSPAVENSLKANLLKEVFEGKISTLTLNFLGILVENNDLNAINKIAEKFRDLVDEANNVLNVKVTTAVEMKPELKQKLEHKLEEKYSKKIKAEYVINKDIIAGIITEISGQRCDYSFRTRLKNIRNIRYEGTGK